MKKLEEILLIKNKIFRIYIMNIRSYKDDYNTLLHNFEKIKQIEMYQLPPAPGQSKGEYTVGDESQLQALQAQVNQDQLQLYAKVLLEEFNPQIVLDQEGRVVNQINDLLQKVSRYPNEPCAQEKLEKLKEEAKYILVKKAVLHTENDQLLRSILDVLVTSALPQYVIDNDLARDNADAATDQILYPKGGKKTRRKKLKKNKKRKSKKH